MRHAHTAELRRIPLTVTEADVLPAILGNDRGLPQRRPHHHRHQVHGGRIYDAEVKDAWREIGRVSTLRRALRRKDLC
jgi:hypothetical protein